MGKLFGTDGIRGVADEYPMTSEMALKIGRAVVHYFISDRGKARIVIGKDTRISGDMLESALVAGICSAKGSVLQAGVMPTPGVAFLTASENADAGIVISASHNPYHDNGIKIFGPSGFKLSDQEEAQIENLILDESMAAASIAGSGSGHAAKLEDAEKKYINFLENTLVKDLKGIKIVIDCSNGATYRVAPKIFTKLGAEVDALFVNPDGKNINASCGSQHPQSLKQRVKLNGADIGLAFDGDGDRLIAVDERGNVISGDQILAVCAKVMQQESTLQKNLVVITVMSNLGLRLALKNLGIKYLLAPVGDRYVLEQMKTSGAVLGGEDSGHMIFLNHHTTGDGILTALQLIAAMQIESRPLSALSRIMDVFPQVLVNIEVKEKPDLKRIPEVEAAIKSVESSLGEEGRVLVRYSGTQPLCRAMVEGPTKVQTKEHCDQIADIIKKKLG